MTGPSKPASGRWTNMKPAFAAAPEKVEAATSFRDDLGVDSIDGIELLSQLQERFALTFEEDEMAQLMPRLMTDLRTVYEFVAENVGW